MKITDIGVENLTRIDYLRISVTDRCNLCCSYCMPEGGIILQDHDKMLTFEEIVRLAGIFSSLGIKKLRLTGGEPLVRKGVTDLAESLGKVAGIEELCLTTNGVFLAKYAPALKQAGLNVINISLDTLKEERFQRITGSDCFKQVIEGLMKAKELDFDSIKLNMVVMKDVNSDEIINFMNFALERNLTLRFIEFMKVTPLWRQRFYIPIEEIKEICHKRFKLEKIEGMSRGPAEYYQTKGGSIGFIKTLQKNCDVCSRLRLTSVGELKACLYQPQGISLRSLLRKGCDDAFIKNTIKNLIILKDSVNYKRWNNSNVYMSSLGG